MTTGPLGQGLASAVGMAMASRRERGLLDPDAAPGESPFDHQIYVICSDGDIEEGITSEASSLAGTQQLGNLTVIYDDNHISIEDDTSIALSEDVAARYEAYGWHVQKVHGAEDVTSVLAAIDAARAETDRPSFIALRTIIGYPAPHKMNTGKAHGAALGADEVAGVKTALGFDPDQSFVVEDKVLGPTSAPAAGSSRRRIRSQRARSGLAGPRANSCCHSACACLPAAPDAPRCGSSTLSSTTKLWSGSKPSAVFTPATSSAPSAAPWALPVFILCGAGSR